MLGSPRRLASGDELKKLRQAVTVLQQSDLVAALSTPGILYLEGYTDLNLLREWARILDHPLRDYLNQTPFWRGKQHPVRPDAAEIPPGEHFAARFLGQTFEQYAGSGLGDQIADAYIANPLVPAQIVDRYLMAVTPGSRARRSNCSSIGGAKGGKIEDDCSLRNSKRRRRSSS